MYSQAADAPLVTNKVLNNRSKDETEGNGPTALPLAKGIVMGDLETRFIRIWFLIVLIFNYLTNITLLEPE